VVHGADEAARAALLLATTTAFALESAYAVSGLVGVAIAVATTTAVVASAGGDVAGIVSAAGALAITVAELLLPALATA
jgi:hypothetical protein